jgi:hypothetical protein
VGLTLDVKEARQRGSEFDSVGHGSLEEFCRLAMVVPSMDLAEADTTNRIGSGDPRKDRCAGSDTSKLVPSGFIEDGQSDLKIRSCSTQSYPCLGFPHLEVRANFAMI